MFSFEKFYTLCNEDATEFNAFPFKIKDREEYLKNPAVLTALANLSNKGGLKILSLPFVFSFEGELRARGYKITDVYAVEKNSLPLSYQVIPTAKNLAGSKIKVWFPARYIAQKRKREYRFITGDIDKIVEQRTSKSAKNKSPTLMRNLFDGDEIKDFKDAEINLIDLDYLGPVTITKMESIIGAQQMLPEHGLLFVTFQARGGQVSKAELFLPIDNVNNSGEYANEYRNLLPPTDKNNDVYGVRKDREKYEKYVTNVAKNIVDYAPALKPIFINSYKGGSGKPQSNEMLRLVFVNDPNNTFRVDENIQVPEINEQLKIKPATAQQIDAVDFAKYVETTGTLLNTFATLYNESQIKSGDESENASMNKAKEAWVTMNLMRLMLGSLATGEDPNNLYEKALSFAKGDKKLVATKMQQLCDTVINLLLSRKNMPKAYKKLYPLISENLPPDHIALKNPPLSRKKKKTQPGKEIDLNKAKQQLNAFEIEMLSSVYPNELTDDQMKKWIVLQYAASGEKLDPEVDVEEYEDAYETYKEIEADYFENLKNKLTRTKVADENSAVTSTRAGSDLSTLQHSLIFGKEPGKLDESDYAQWAAARLKVKLKTNKFTEEQLKDEIEYLKKHGADILSKKREEKEKKYEEKSDTPLSKITRLFQGEEDKIIFDKPVLDSTVRVYFGKMNKTSTDYVKELARDEHGEVVVLSIRRKNEAELALKDVHQRAKDLKLGETIELEEPIRYSILERNINKLYKDENIESPMKQFSFTFVDDAVKDIRKREVKAIKRERTKYLLNAELKQLFDSLEKDEIKDVSEYGITLAELVTTIKTFRHGEPRAWAMASADADGRVSKIAKMGDGLAEDPQDLKLILPIVEPAKIQHVANTIGSIISRLQPGQEHEFGKPVTKTSITRQIQDMRIPLEHYELTPSTGDKISKIRRKTSEEINAEKKEGESQKEMMSNLIKSLKNFEPIINIPSQMKMAKAGRPIAEICNDYDLYFTKQDQYGRKIRYSISTMYDVLRDKDSNIRQLRLRDTPSKQGEIVRESTSTKTGGYLNSRSFNKVYKMLLMEL